MLVFRGMPCFPFWVGAKMPPTLVKRNPAFMNLLWYFFVVQPDGFRAIIWTAVSDNKSLVEPTSTTLDGLEELKSREHPGHHSTQPLPTVARLQLLLSILVSGRTSNSSLSTTWDKWFNKMVKISPLWGSFQIRHYTGLPQTRWTNNISSTVGMSMYVCKHMIGATLSVTDNVTNGLPRHMLLLFLLTVLHCHSREVQTYCILSLSKYLKQWESKCHSAWHAVDWVKCDHICLCTSSNRNWVSAYGEI